MNDLTVIAASGMALPDAVRVNRHWIGGVWRESAASFERVSPSHGVVVSRSALGGAAEVEAGEPDMFGEAGSVAAE